MGQCNFVFVSCDFQIDCDRIGDEVGTDQDGCGGTFGDDIFVGVEIDWAYKWLQFNGPLDDLTLLGQPANIGGQACRETFGWGALAIDVRPPTLHRIVGLYATAVAAA